MFLSKRGNNYYLYYVGEDGKRQRVSTRSNLKSEALKFFRSFKVNSEVEESVIRNITLSEFKEEFLEYSAGVQTVRAQRHFNVALREFTRIWGDIALTEIDGRSIDNFLTVKTKEASTWTARKYYGALASAFETAHRWKYLELNPFRGVKKPKGREIQPLYLSKAQLSMLFQTIKDKDFKDVCVFAACTGMRLGEIINLRWSSVDMKRGTILVENSLNFTTKNKRNRMIPINRSVKKILTGIAKENEPDLIFLRNGRQYNPDELARKFKTYVIQMGFDKKLHFQHLRHSFCSQLALQGVSIYSIAKLAGHADIRTPQIYSHLCPSELRDGVSRVCFL